MPKVAPDCYFQTLDLYYMYNLVNASGKVRNEALDVIDECYADAKIAKFWYKNMLKNISRHGNHGDYKLAVENLNELYAIMTDDKY